MDFKRGQLRNFVVVAEEGQMTRAARKLRLAQPALSHTISQLESELGLVLLERHARGVTLTPAGEAFLPKARSALAAAEEAIRTAQSLARAGSDRVEVGYVGPPPQVNAPELFTAFVEARPDASVSYRELPFPTTPTAAWLEEVDVAFGVAPAAERGVRTQPVRAEPRAVVMPDDHPLAERRELRVADLLDERFISYHDDVQADWAAFHSFDDLRRAPAQYLTGGRARTAPEMLTLIAQRRAIAMLPHSDARVVEQVLRGVVAIPVNDAGTVALSLIWLESNTNPCVRALALIAEGLASRNGVAHSRSVSSQAPPRPAERAQRRGGA
jgi:DNA-binding transcriptional LysR family regulator